MIIRIWRAGVDPNRLEEYLFFARNQSLSMFQAHDGYQGVIFAAEGNEAIVASFWTDRNAADALAHSPLYKTTVQTILKAGFLTGEQTLEIFGVTDLDIMPLTSGPSDETSTL